MDIYVQVNLDASFTVQFVNIPFHVLGANGISRKRWTRYNAMKVRTEWELCDMKVLNNQHIVVWR